jgi:sulfoquinovosidase
MHKSMSVRMGLLILLVSMPPGLAQSVKPFASTPEYKSMLSELARQAPRPSRIADAGELITGKQPDVPVEERESAEGLRLETQVWTLEITKNSFGIAFTNKLTGANWKLAGVNYEGSGATSAPSAEKSTASAIIRLERAGSVERRQGRWVLVGTPEGSPQAARIEISLAGPNAVCISIDASGLGVETSSEFHITGPGPFFGLGEQYAQANLDNFKISLHPDDKPGTPGHLWDYMSIPFVCVYFDTAFNGLFDSTGAGQPGFTMRFGGASVDFYLLAALDPKGVLKTYTGLTGRTPLPPPWAFGVWHNSLEGSEAVLKDAQNLRNAGIPVSALWVSDLMDPSDNVGWPLWTTGYYGPPGSFTEDLHKLGFKVLGYFYPYVRSLLYPYPLENPTFAEAIRNHFLVTDPQGKPVGPTFEAVLTGNVDFTNPEAVNWWQEKIQRSLSQYDFDGWMEDFGEWIHDDHHFAAGKTGREMATLNPLFWHKITYEIAHRAKPDVVEFARSGAPGSQAFTRVLWGGDQVPDWSSDNGLASVVTAGITAGLSGFAVWGPDIQSGGTSKELFIRWAEFGAMTPIMRDHLWSKPQFAVDLWFDSQTTDVFRRYARLHVSLFPYLYTFAHEATRTGLPIIRHPMLEFPDDRATYDTEYEYLLGDRLLVAPVVTEGATTRTLYLPSGSWVNYWSGEILEGRKEVTLPAPLEEIPILARAGSVIPFIRPDIDTLAADLQGEKHQTLDNSLVWRIFPSREAATASFTAYDGAKISVEQSTTIVRVQGESPKLRQYDVVLTMDKAPREVLMSGHPLDKLGDSAVRTEKTGWTFDPNTKTLHVLFLDSDFKLQVMIG